MLVCSNDTGPSLPHSSDGHCCCAELTHSHTRGIANVQSFVQDNGAGMPHDQIPDMLGRVLSGTKYGVGQTRGKFGLGAKMALIWSKMTTGMPFEIASAQPGKSYQSYYQLDIDIHKNAPNVHAVEVRPRWLVGADPLMARRLWVWRPQALCRAVRELGCRSRALLSCRVRNLPAPGPMLPIGCVTVVWALVSMHRCPNLHSGMCNLVGRDLGHNESSIVTLTNSAIPRCRSAPTQASGAARSSR